MSFCALGTLLAVAFGWKSYLIVIVLLAILGFLMMLIEKKVGCCTTLFDNILLRCPFGGDSGSLRGLELYLASIYRHLRLAAIFVG